ncbi:MAG: FapA family protein [Oscillospiraceae bacterium]
MHLIETREDTVIGDAKNNSLIFGLFNRANKSENDEDKENTAIAEEAKAAKDKAELENKARKEDMSDSEYYFKNIVWRSVMLATLDERCEYLQISADTKNLFAKMTRREYHYPVKKSTKTAEGESENPQEALTDTAKTDDDAEDLINTVSVGEAVEEEPIPDWDMDFLQNVLKDIGINNGIDEAALEEILLPTYDKEIVFAIGTPAVNGSNAILKENFPREAKPHFETRPDGSIDFKNMHMVTSVEKGTVICELIAPTPGVDGLDIYSNKITARPGNKLILARGENTETLEVSKELTQLIASCSGSLVYRKDKFCIDNVFKVDGNVDNGTGNIDFVGNVVITGDVLEGYSVKTQGSITVFGTVEGASLYADEDIHIEKGINGMGKGILKAGGEITAKFIENCTVTSGGNIASESIINSKVECDGDIKVTGKGLIIGGKITDFGSITAKVIGSNSSTPTIIILGTTPSILRERSDVDMQLKETNAQCNEAKKSITYLEGLIANGHNSDKANQTLASLNGKLTIGTLKKQRLEKRRDEISAEILAAGNSTLTCATIYPPGRVTIGSSNMIIKETCNNCRFYRNSEGEISIGMK